MKRSVVINNSINYYFESFPMQLAIVIISLFSCLIYITSTYGYPMLDTTAGITLEIFFLCVLISFQSLLMIKIIVISIYLIIINKL